MNRILIPTVLSVLLASCNDRRDPQDPSPARVPTPEASDRPAFLRALDDEMAAIDRDLATLKERVQAGGAEVRQEMRQALDTLPARRDALRQRLTEMGARAADATEQARNDLRDSFRNLRAEIRRVLGTN